MEIVYNSDVIVIGAGPAGIAAAISVARGGRKVVLIDKNQYAGCKNMYGGAVFDCALREIAGDEIDNLPYERIINSHTWAFLTPETSFELTYKNKSAQNSYAVKRFNLEKWLVELAKKEGVYYAPNTLVKDLAEKDGRIIGIKTELEEFYAPIIIIAEGVNSLLTKKLGLRKDFKPKDMLLTIKETIKLDKKTIESRFNLQPSTSGAAKMYFGGVRDYKDLFMMTFLYTFKDTVMLGLGVNMVDLDKNKININTLLDEIKQHPDISPLIEDGKTIEYSAHLIPETGYKKMPEAAKANVMLAGDCAGFINNVHFEGTNFALISGKLAGQTALEALDKAGFNSMNGCADEAKIDKEIKNYKKKLKKSFILKDLYSYRNVIEKLYSRRESLSYYYPERIKEFFEIVTSANCVSKSSQFRKFAFNFIEKRAIKELFKDIFAFSKCAFDVFFGK